MPLQHRDPRPEGSGMRSLPRTGPGDDRVAPVPTLNHPHAGPPRRSVPSASQLRMQRLRQCQPAARGVLRKRSGVKLSPCLEVAKSGELPSPFERYSVTVLKPIRD